MSIKILFGKRIRFFREVKGWSQEELADQACIHRTYVSGIERGLRNPSLTNIERLAEALGVKIEELFLTSETQVKEC